MNDHTLPQVTWYHSALKPPSKATKQPSYPMLSRASCPPLDTPTLLLLCKAFLQAINLVKSPS
uniref:Uncharacterized protein n=1 Tax=Picea glauca TaxID=3330 RepID=A0A124GNR8_PICGL|nr:hypothetical protein ABT39_MTgene2913 [Picea glauca]QHR90411.1 hypothetical protein Q903MT_gene4435 [Picea sitchensis]